MWQNKVLSMLGVVFLVFSSSPGEASPTMNLVQNGDFSQVSRINPLQAEGWKAVWGTYRRVIISDERGNDNAVVMLYNDPSAGSPVRLAAMQKVVLDQVTTHPVSVTVWVKGQSIEDVSNDNFGASLYAKIIFKSGRIGYSKNTWKTKNLFTFPWRQIGFNTGSYVDLQEPITSMEIYVMLGPVRGTAYFDDVVVQQYPTDVYPGVLSLVIDDGESAAYSIAYQKYFKPRKMPFSVAPPVEYIGTRNHMRLTDLHELQTGGCTVMSHSYNHINLAETQETVMFWNIEESWKYFWHNGFSARHFVPPYGGYDAAIIGKLQSQGYVSARLVERGLNPPGVFPYSIRIEQINRATMDNMQDVTNQLLLAQSKHRWLVWVCHTILPGSTPVPAGDDYQYDINEAGFAEIIRRVEESGIKVLSFDDAFRLYVKGERGVIQNSVGTVWTMY